MASTATFLAAATASVFLLLLLLLLLRGGFTVAAPVNVTEILERGQQYSKFILYLDSAQAGKRIDNHLNTSGNEITIFAPTDNAFDKLPQGAFNKLTPQQQTEVMLYHAVSKFFTWDNFQTVSNPVLTMAGGDYEINVISGRNRQVNISTGFVTVPVNNEVNLTSPVAVYSIETVLQPLKLFRVPALPPSTGAPGTNDTTSKPPISDKPPSKEEEKGNSDGAFQMNAAWWWSSALMVAVASLWAVSL